MPPQYGITRKINAQNFFDVYFGEFFYLFKDVAKAPGIENKLLYIFMPPGWSHTGDHKTAKAVKKEYLQKIEPEVRVTTIEQPEEKLDKTN